MLELLGSLLRGFQDKVAPADTQEASKRPPGRRNPRRLPGGSRKFPGGSQEVTGPSQDASMRFQEAPKEA